MTDPSTTTNEALSDDLGHLLGTSHVSTPPPVDALYTKVEQRGRRQRAWLIGLLALSAILLAGLVGSLYGSGSSGELVAPDPTVPAAGQPQRPLVSFVDVIPTLIGDIWVSTLVTFGVVAAVALLIWRLRRRTVARPMRPVFKILFGVAAGLIVLLVGVRLSLQMYYLPSSAMEPSIELGSRVLVARNDTEADVGDVVIHRLPVESADASRSFIKRVVAVGGDTVQATDGQLLVNDEPALALAIDSTRPIGDFGPVQVPVGQYFVMGDNYPNSADSRQHGPISADLIEGTVRWSTKGWRG